MTGAFVWKHDSLNVTQRVNAQNGNSCFFFLICFNARWSSPRVVHSKFVGNKLHCIDVVSPLLIPINFLKSEDCRSTDSRIAPEEIDHLAQVVSTSPAN